MTETEQAALAVALDRGLIALPETGPILVQGLGAGAPLDALPQTRALLLEDFEPQADRLAQRGWTVQPVPATSKDLRARLTSDHGTLPRLILYIPGKQRERALGDLALLAEILAEGGILAMAVANTGGAARSQGDLDALFGNVGVLSKHKCRVLWAAKGAEFKTGLAAEWIAGAAARALPLLPDKPAIATVPGLFAWDRIDAGSGLLAAHLPASLAGVVADLGCGWGYLSSEILARCPGVTRIDAVDADSRAVALARQNLTDPRVSVRWADATQPHGVAQWDAVVMNPPFHQGRAAVPDLGKAFIRAAAHGLKPGGKLLLVANRSLPYEADLEAEFASWRSLLDQDGFKLLEAIR
jgi:16S rRNA (guanine1207-N2)-methyltransferase